MDAHRAFENFCYNLKVPGKAALRISINGRPIFDDGGRFLGYRGTGANITEKFEIEERNRQLFAALDAVAEIIALYDADDRLVFANRQYRDINAAAADHMNPGDTFEDLIRAAVTAGLIPHAEDREDIEHSLKKAIEIAESANSIKTDFLASMSHELRTPLNAVIGFSDAIRHRALGPISEGVYDGYIINIHDSGEHLLALINDILDVSLIEAGQLRLYEEEVDVASVIETCLRMVAPQAETAGLRLEHRTIDPMPPLFADERRIKRALINVLSNAIKCTPAEGSVLVELARNDANGMKITVSDTGIGMSSDEIILASTPFGRAQSAVVSDKGGSGLGLPLTLRLVEAHGGRVDIDSARNRGTTVTLNFPADRVVE